MAQAQSHTLEMARSASGHGHRAPTTPARGFLARGSVVKNHRSAVKSANSSAGYYAMSRHRPHSRQILKLCSNVCVSSNAPVASSCRAALMALRHRFTGTSWKRCLRNISERRSRAKLCVSNVPSTCPAVGPLARTLHRANTFRNKNNFNEDINHGAGGIPTLFRLRCVRRSFARLTPLLVKRRS